MLKSLIEYLVNNLGVDRNTASTIIITLAIFACGYIISGVVLVISKWRQRFIYRRSLKIIISEFFNSCEKQYDQFKIFSAEKGFSDGADYQITLVSNFALQYLTSLDVTIFIKNFSSLTSRKRAIEISNFLEIVELIKENKSTLQKSISMAFDSYSENLAIYNKNIHELRSLINIIALDFNGRLTNEIEPSLHEYIGKILEVFSLWSEKGEKNAVNDTANDLVSPILKISTETKPNSYSFSATNSCVLCLSAHENILNAEEMIRTEVEHSAKTYQNAFEKGRRITQHW
jgi:hypothetical protein